MARPRAVIAEDEAALRRELREALAQLWPELEIVAEAEDGLEAVQALETHRPDLIFLDVQMPGMTGLEVARVASGRCHVAFLTAYDQYAVAAFEQGAIDYVLKPFSTGRLALSVARLRERVLAAPQNLDGMLRAVAERNRVHGQYLRWITVAQGRSVRLVTVDDVCYFQADTKYTLVATASEQLLIQKPIKELLAELDPDVFVQIHRGTIVNLEAIDAVDRDLRGRLRVQVKRRKESLPVSATFAHVFKRM